MFVQTVFISLLQVVLGLALCFAGFRLFVMVLPVLALFGGFLITAQVIQELFGGGFLISAGSWVLGIVVGLLCAVAAYYFFYAAVIVLAATVGYELGVGLMAGFGVNAGLLQFLVGVVVAAVVIAAVIFLNLPKVVIVALTAEVGATMILTGFLLAIGHISPAALHWGVVGAFIRDSWFWFLAFLAIAAAGIVVQLLLPEDFVPEPYSKEEVARRVSRQGQLAAHYPPWSARGV
jgi:hypothetical protein